MVTLQNLSFEFGGRWLYRGVNWHIREGERIGLIGKNGTGKSTLLRLIAGQYSPTEGTITKPNDFKLGFLNQDLLSFESSTSIFEVALGAFDQLLATQKQIDVLLEKLETDQSDALLNELAELQHSFEVGGGYTIEARTHEVLSGLGFSDEEHFMPYSSFSGGWRMRVMLAKILLTEPNLLLLDEPTNHLDLPSIQWIEDYLQGFGGAYVIVSHDRYFLDRMVKQIVEIANQKLHHYTGNYTKYLEQKAERIVIQQAAYDNQQKQIADAERFIERFKAKATKAAQAQSRIKMLDKLERIDAPEDDEPTVSFRFHPTERAGQDVFTLKNVSKQFDKKVILNQASAVIQRGDKIGLIGANGTGKSTVLRIIAQTEPCVGERILGYKVTPTFFAQHQLEALNLKYSIWEQMYEEAREFGETYVRAILGGFLFTGDDIHKKVGVLSGGEKSRVALAKTLLARANFLLLDEPTNHLDMQSIQILTEALKNYDGTYIVVSHDRYFLSEITNKIWYLENKQIKEYPGTFSEFEAWKQRQVGINQQFPEKTANISKVEAVKPQPKPVSTLDPKTKKQLENKLKSLEQAISNLEQDKSKVMDALANCGTDYEKIRAHQITLQTVETNLNEKIREWEAVVEVLEG